MKLPAKPFLLFAVIICLVGKSNAQYYYYNPVDNLNAGLDTGFLVISAMLVFYMQAGFSMLEVGCVRVKNTKSILLKNTMDICVSAIAFWMCGFAFAFGVDDDGEVDNDFIGWGNFFLEDLEIGANTYAFFFFQFGFASATSTIVSGCIAERTTFIGYIAPTFVLVAFTYPVIAHWIFGGGWLADWGNNGFLDFAGSGVVHTTGGVSGAIGAAIVGARLGRFIDGKPRAIPGYSTTLICLGVYILWFGWYGFNPGSIVAVSGGGIDVASLVAVNTSLAACTGAIVTLFFWWIVEREWSVGAVLNGVLAGLVGVTGPCAFVEPWASLIIGGIAGLVYVGASKLLVLMKIDDPLDAAPIHAGCGMWGVIAAGLFAVKNRIRDVTGGEPGGEYGLFWGGGFEQLGIQVVGLLAIIGWSAAFAAVTFGLMRLIGWLRVDPNIEKRGVDSQGHGSDSWARVEIMDNGRMEEFQFRIQ